MSESAPSLFHSARFSDPRQVLESIFGYREFRPGQRPIIDAVLAGRDCIGVMPTGAGKSLTFQLPAKLLDGAVLVISPLISLMKDQVDALVRLGFKATLLNSTVDFEERRRRVAALKRGEIELVYVAPEGLEGSLRQLIAGCRVSLVVVDEAHCISHWGHDFRPAYRRLSGLKQELGDIPVLALTATATRRVADDIVRELGMRSPETVKGSFFRPNLIISARKKGALEDGRRGDTRREMLAVIRRHAGESGIVYCLSRRGVEGTTEWLRTQGVRAAAYHAGLADEQRERHQNAFRRREVDVIVATVAFGMGIDQSGVRFVIHRDMPRSIEAWYQEIGRAGRDGSASDCVVFYSWADVMGFDNFLVEIEDPVLREETRKRTVDLFRLLDRKSCRHQAMVRHFDEVIEPCAASCDVCLGDDSRALAPLTAPARSASTRSRSTRVRGVTGTAGTPARGRAATAVAEELPVDEALFERLRTLRLALARSESVPAFVVFSDAVLRRMASLKPRSSAQLLAISGVGPAKLERYGDAFLKLLREG